MKKTSRLLYSYLQRIIALLLIGGGGFSLSGCSGNIKDSYLPMSQLSEIPDVYNGNDIFALCEFGNNSTYTDYGLTVVNAVEALEDYLNRIEKLEKINFTNVSLLTPISEEQCKETLSLSDNDVDSLIELAKYRGDDIVLQEKRLDALKKLNYLYNHDLDWVKSYGRGIVLDYMMAAVKGALSNELGLSYDQYESIKIGSKPDSADGDRTCKIFVGDQAYMVSSSVDEIHDTIYYIYAVQEADLTDETFMPTIKKALGLADRTVLAGINVNSKNKVKADNSDTQIRKAVRQYIKSAK